MALISLDPRFDFTIYAIQVYHFVYPYLKLHINLFSSRRKQKKARHCYALVRIHTPLSDLRVPIEEYKVNYAFLEKNFQNSKLLRCEIRKMTPGFLKNKTRLIICVPRKSTHMPE
jgi:hypothetical protein